jgi:cell division protease FtsH
MAKAMVTEYGMSQSLGPLNYGGGQHEIFLGRDFTQRRDLSEDTAKLIDEEIRTIVMRNYQRARQIIEEKRERLVAMAEALLVRETLEDGDIELLMKGGTLPPKTGAGPTAPATVESPEAAPGLEPAPRPA